MRRSGHPTPAVLVVFVTALLLAGTVVAPVAAVPVDSRPTGAVGPPDHTHRLPGCFPADGTEFVVGTEGPQIRFTLHLSLLPAVVTAESPTNLTDVANVTDAEGGETNVTAVDATAAGAFGIEATATTGRSQVVSLQTGVLFAGVDGATAFLTDPFEPFAFVFDYRLTIPAFENTSVDADYRVSDVPIEGPVEEAACSQ